MDEIYYLMRHGGGAFIYSDCYEMPTQVRKYNVRKLSEDISNENDERKKAGTKGTSLSMKDLVKTGHTDYMSKSSKK